MTEVFQEKPGEAGQINIAQGLLTFAVDTTVESSDPVLTFWLKLLFNDNWYDNFPWLHQVD